MAGTFQVARSQAMSASPDQVFDQIGDLARWDDWSPWAEMDPDMSKEYGGTPGTVGSNYSWTGNRKVGQGRMEITAIEPDESVTIDLRFIKPFKSDNVTRLDIAPDGDGSAVTWTMTGPTNLMTKTMSLFGRTMDKMIGPDFEKGLAALKTIVEA